MWDFFLHSAAAEVYSKDSESLSQVSGGREDVMVFLQTHMDL